MASHLGKKTYLEECLNHKLEKEGLGFIFYLSGRLGFLKCWGHMSNMIIIEKYS